MGLSLSHERYASSLQGGSLCDDWSRKEKNLAKDFEATEKNGPWPYIVVGIIMTVLFIGTILAAVRFALS